MIKVVPIEGKGRGVVTTEDIDAATIISAAPVLEVEQPDTFERTHSIYTHCWTKDNGGRLLYYLTLGVQTLVNHADTPNCISFMHNDEDLLVSIRWINSGEELTLNYYDCCDSFDGEF